VKRSDRLLSTCRVPARYLSAADPRLAIKSSAVPAEVGVGRALSRTLGPWVAGAVCLVCGVMTEAFLVR
jgi:hypothetical protein